jgi:type IV pilus assembly protein PilY1
MTKQRKTHISLLACLFSLMISGVASTAHAAPGRLAQQPLFLQTAVPPNIFFLNDNSGSMNSELLTDDYGNQGLLSANSDTLQPPLVPHHSCSSDDASYEFILETEDSGSCRTVAEEEWRARLSDYNHMYYNPDIEYKPWMNGDGGFFPDANITAAKFDPNDPQSDEINLLTESAVLLDGDRDYYDFSNESWHGWCQDQGINNEADCRGWRYYTWSDADEDGVIDQNELTIHWVKDLPSGAGENPPVNSQKNFANWFTYHRNREFAAKYAISRAVNEASNARIGYGTINNSNGQNNNIRIDYPDASHTNNGVTTTHKQDVLTKLFGTTSAHSTPLRDNLNKVGNYYETGNFFGDSGSSPILSEAEGGACQSNNVILMTDGFYHGEAPDVGNVDGDKGAPYADSWSNTLADVAMRYYERDISGLPDGMTVSEKDWTPDRDDTTTHQHMNTHTLAFGPTGTFDPVTTDINAAGFSWPEPLQDSPGRIDDLFHAAVNGRGNYLSAANPDELVQALLSTVSGITDQTQSSNAVATSSLRLQEGALIYFSRFNPGDWSGEVIAHNINSDGAINPTPAWDTTRTLANENNFSRTILTYNGSHGVPFQWGRLSEAQRRDLRAGDAADTGQARLDYLRGAVNEDFRERSSLLGDIIDSSPVYVGAPWHYTMDRTPVLYIGANDGMLHGFNAETGEELLAYVPATLFPNLHELTDPDYVHRYFVDQTPTVADAYFDAGGGLSPAWHTVLVSGLGAGGRGLFALDITDPSSFTEAQARKTVLWEFNSAIDSDLGYTLSKPVIALTTENRWAAIVGNGYNSDSGDAALFIIYLDADPSDGWQEGSDYLKISTETGNAANKNGLSSPTAVDTNGDGYVDRVYAGDLQGNMWAFDLSSSSANNWDVAYTNAAGDPQPLFHAANEDGQSQAITVKPSVVRNPYQPTISDTDPNANTTPNLMILFGTGQYLTANDLNNIQTQSFYGVWDKGQAFVDDQHHLDALSRDNLIGQTITSATTGDGGNARITSNNDVPYGDATDTQRFGWYIDLASAHDDSGERVISNAVVINNIVFFTTFIPSDDTCSAGGSSWFMFLNLANGGQPPESVVSINNDTLFNEEDLVMPSDSDSETVASGLEIEGITLAPPTINFGGNGSDTGQALLNTSQGIRPLNIDTGGPGLGSRISWRELRRE